MHLWLADGPGTPRTDPEQVLAFLGLTEPRLQVTLGWMVETPEWLEKPTLDLRAVHAGHGLAGAVNGGRIRAIETRLSAVAALIRSDPPDIALVSAVRRGSQLVFGRCVGWADVLARHAGSVVVEVDEHGVDLGGPVIEGNVVAEIERPHADTPASTSRAADDVDHAIARFVASVLPDDATIQMGPGGISDAIAGSLEKPVGIWTGLVTESMANLAERGLLRAPAVTSYTWGGAGVEAMARNGHLRLVSSTQTHDLSAIEAIDRFVGCNTALQIDLEGAANVSMVGDRVLAGVGGHADFCLGATRSTGGLSILATRSTTSRGESTIRRTVDRVSTPAQDVNMVITEHGIADLRGVPLRDRASLITDVAAPEHRSALT